MKSPFSIRRRNDVLCLLSTCNIGMFMKSDMYSKHAEQYDLVVQDNIYNAHFERPSLQAMLDDLSGKDVLDLGCGSGVYAEFLIKQGLSNITCIDASEEMIELVRNKLGEQVSSYTQDLSIGLPQEKSKSIDVIICPLVIHYLEDHSMFFNDVGRVLKSGGYIVFFQLTTRLLTLSVQPLGIISNESW